MSNTATKIQDLIVELEHIVTLFEDADDAELRADAVEELQNYAGTINTILSEDM